MTEETETFVLGVDLDGCVSNFLERMKVIFAEWEGRDLASLHPKPTYGFPEWGLNLRKYNRLHRFAVTQRQLFSTMEPIDGAPQALRRLSAENVRIRIVSHRLFIPYFHEAAASQTILWLEKHGIPYWDLCLIKDKSAVRADVFVEDTPSNVRKLQSHGVDVICFTNPSNEQEALSVPRVSTWQEAEQMIRSRHYEWRRERGLPLPPGPGEPPPGEDAKWPDETPEENH